MNMKFGYNKTILFVGPLLLIAVLIMIQFLIKDSNDWKNVMYIILILIVSNIIIILFFNYSHHELRDSIIFINIGILFRGKISYENVKSIDYIDKQPFRTGFGIYFSPFHKQIGVITVNENLISIKLKNPQRFGWGAIGKKANEIIINVNKPNEFVNAVREKIETHKSKNGDIVKKIEIKQVTKEIMDQKKEIEVGKIIDEKEGQKIIVEKENILKLKIENKVELEKTKEKEVKLPITGEIDLRKSEEKEKIKEDENELKYLFSLDGDYKWHIQEGEVSKDLRRIFEENGILLSGKAEIVKDEEKWLIRDSNKIFIVEDKDEELIILSGK